MKRPDLSVVVVTWNVRELALACLGRVRERSGTLQVEVLVVDNGSSDGTAEAVRAAFPDVRILPNRENLGFPRANNLALAEARGRHVLFLNPDTEVGEGTLEACVAELDRDPRLGAVGCRLEYPDGRVQYECGRRAYRLRHLVWEAFYLHVLFLRSALFAHQLMGDWDHRDVRDVEALSGAFLMARREAVLEVGGLPDELFMYHEDLALCLRLGRSGWGIRCLGDRVTLHHAGASASGSPSPLELLEGEVRVRLVRERSGLLAGVAARVLFGMRQAVRLSIAVATRPVPALRSRLPRVTDVARHAMLLAWTVRPGIVRRRLGRSGIPPDRRPGLLVVAPTPPPVHGTSVYTAMLLSSMSLRSRFRVHHVEVADRRSLDNLGRVDARNVALGLVHVARVAVAAWTRRPALAYVPLSQNGPAFLRDALFVGAARSAGARVITHLHGGYFATFYREAPPPLRAVIRLAHRGVYRCWVLGEGLRGLFDGLLPPERVRVVPNGVPPVLDPPGARRGAPGPFTVLHLGHLSEAKGLGDLLSALERLAEGGRAVRCLVAGSYATSREEGLLGPRVATLEARGLVHALGLVRGAEKADAFTEADAFVLATKYPFEGQPLAILEAMSAALPVVATPRAAIPDMVVDGETGLLVPEDDVTALAGALERLAADPGLRARMGDAGYARYRSRFTREHALARAEEELDDALR